LKEVYLDLNHCINENFKDPNRIAIMKQIVNEKCGFEGKVEDQN
jgi:hypothetical protein